MDPDRPLLVFVSDIHLTDVLHAASVPRAVAFERFWSRIQAARGQRPAEICFCGDLFDLVRSPSWLDSAFRPYHDPSEHVVAMVDRIVDAILEREKPFFAAIRAQVESGALRVHYLLGNHDRLLRFAKGARRRIWKAMTGEDRDVEFPAHLTFPDHGVLAYHGHAGDPINDSPGGGATIGDALAIELIVRFPRAMRQLMGKDHAELDDIDDVRPIYAVPAWVRQLGVVQTELLRPASEVWTNLVEAFLGKPFVKNWMKDQRRPFALDTGKKLRLMLELSTGKIMAKGHDQRLTKAYKLMQHAFDGRMALRAADELQGRSGSGLRFVVNGHSHFASMVPLGRVDGAPAAYFNTGTWRTVHQIGHAVGGRPSFLPYDAMSYLVFFPTGDPMGRDYEWWNGALVARRDRPSGADPTVP